MRDRRTRMTIGLTAPALVLLVGLTGCGPDEATSSQPADPGSDNSAVRLDGGGIDGPVMYSAPHAGDFMAAQILGTLELHDECLYAASDDTRYPVLWPHGTTWHPDAATVVVPNGTTIPVGGQVTGGGGLLKPDALAGFIVDDSVVERAEQCSEPPFFEVAVLQSV